ncbi:MAG: glycoside hydrolase 43 family protein [Opitutaceae bacterium]|nr:glycoside hydrolase 43 family protein [Opitutaceae bacterium]
MPAPSSNASWTADNGDGTYTNPLFFEEFSDPDVIRVGDDYYLAGTSMHVMPGIPILHSRDLVNWTLASYVYDRLALSPGFHLAEGKEIYGQGTWAPTLRHHAGVFYVLTNVNGHRTQVFRATDPRGPWTRNELNVSFHDLSILFDDDGRVYAIHGHQEIHQVELNSALTEVIPGTHRIIIPEGSGMGEGVHFYKFRGRYFILSSVWDPVCYMVGARADRPEGPYEITTLSADESFGISMGWRIAGNGRIPPPFKKVPPHPTRLSRIPLHQGGLVETASGEWWALSMMDHNGVGRVTALSPVTWQDGWPYFGLPGNLGRTPRTPRHAPRSSPATTSSPAPP